VERYIDTPVKRYSSGMYVRLAFAVAAHLEPEILIVDEVLAVGDAEFQKKCLGKMKDVSVNQGRTVLFVSHNMAAVKQLCTKGIVMLYGMNRFIGTQYDAVNFYQNSRQTNSSFLHEGNLSNAPGNENIRILRFEVSPLNGDNLSISSGVKFQIEFYNQNAEINLDATFELKSSDEVVVFHHGIILSQHNDSQRGIYKVNGVLPPHFLNAGIFIFNLIFGENQRFALFTINDFIQFEVMNEMIGSNANQLPGLVRPDIQYSVSLEPI
jgi:lipopolysaccharide transport system ATP-binding protein